MDPEQPYEKAFDAVVGPSKAAEYTCSDWVKAIASSEIDVLLSFDLEDLAKDIYLLMLETASDEYGDNYKEVAEMSFKAARAFLEQKKIEEKS